MRGGMSMDMRTPSSDPRIEQFWTRYLEVLRLFRVPNRALPWYRRHIQGFIDDHSGIRLHDQTPERLQH